MTSLSPALVWRQADDDLFVATSDTDYAGFIDGAAPGVRAHGARGEDLGAHATADLARAAVAASRAPVTVTAPRARRWLRGTAHGATHRPSGRGSGESRRRRSS